MADLGERHLAADTATALGEEDSLSDLSPASYNTTRISTMRWMCLMSFSLVLLVFFFVLSSLCIVFCFRFDCLGHYRRSDGVSRSVLTLRVRVVANPSYRPPNPLSLPNVLYNPVSGMGVNTDDPSRDAVVASVRHTSRRTASGRNSYQRQRRVPLHTCPVPPTFLYSYRYRTTPPRSHLSISTHSPSSFKIPIFIYRLPGRRPVRDTPRHPRPLLPSQLQQSQTHPS